MEAKELRQKTAVELTALVTDLRRQLGQAQLAVANRQVKKITDKRRLQRDLARALTVLRQCSNQTA